MPRWRRLWIRLRWGTSWDAVIVVMVFAGLVGTALWHVRQEHLAKALVGELCYASRDCRSGDCLEL